MLTLIEWGVAGLALVVALGLRPWRMLRGALLTPALAAVALLPWLWLLPQKMPQGLQIQLSGASLLVLMLGWPLAVLVLALIGLVVWAVGQAGAEQEQADGAEHGQTRVDGPLRDPPEPSPELEKHGKANAADDHGSHQGR